MFHSIAPSVSRWRPRSRSIRVIVFETLKDKDLSWKWSMARMYFHFRRSAQTSSRVRTQWWVRNRSPRSDGHFFVVNSFPVLFRKLTDVFVHLPAAHKSRFETHRLHGINFDFNSISIQVIRNLDFQHWAIFCISSNPSFRRGSVIISRWRKNFGMNQHIRILSIPCHSLSWNIAHEKSFFIKPASSLALLTRMSSGRFSNLL